MTEALTITTSARDDHQLDMSIQLGPERTEKALRQAAKRVSKQVRIPGFRPGRAPFRTVLSRFGREALLNEILDDLGQEVFQEALEQEKIKPYAQAGLENVELDPITFKLVVPLSPEVDLGDYRSIRIEAPEVNITEADVDELLEKARDERTELQTVARAAEVGDTVILDITGTVGDDTIMDNQDWELALKSETGWLPGFDEAFIGMSASEEKTFSLIYPEDSASRYRGQEATFKATLKEVRAKIQPELDDEFAKSLGDYEDMADLRAKMLENLTQQRTAEAEDRLIDDAVEVLMERASLSYPPVAVDAEAHEMLHELENQLAPSGYSLEDFLRLQSKTAAQYQEEIHPQAESRFRRRLVLRELIRAEGIEVTDAECQAEVGRIASGAEDEKRAKSLRDMLSTEAGHQVIEQSLLTEKALARLREIVTGQAPELSAEVAEAPAPETEAVADADVAAGKNEPTEAVADAGVEAGEEKPAETVEPAEPEAVDDPEPVEASPADESDALAEDRPEDEPAEA